MISICQFVRFLRLIMHSKYKPTYIQSNYSTKNCQPDISCQFASCNSRNRISLYSFYPIINARGAEFRLWRVSREYPNSTETKWKRAKIYNLAESSFISSCRESYSGILSVVAIRGAFAFFMAPRRRDLSTGFPMLPFSRSNLPTCSSYIYLSYLRYVCPPSDVETTATIRPVEHNSVGTPFLFFFSPLSPLNLF